MGDDGEAFRRIVVLGACGSGLERAAALLGKLCGGLTISITPGIDDGSLLGEMNENLLSLADGSWKSPPEMPPLELARTLAPQRQRAQRAFEQALGNPSGVPKSQQVTPWVWADPRLAFLMPFWMDALEMSPLVVWVIRNPGEAVAELARDDRMAPDTAATLWQRYNRAALSASQGLDVLMVRHETLVSGTGEGLERVAGFLGRHGVRCLEERLPTRGSSRGEGEEASRPHLATPADTSPPVGAHEQDVLYNVLLSLEEDGSVDASAVGDSTAAYYDEGYYQSQLAHTGLSYCREEPHWLRFFDNVASEIVRSINPKKVMDVGCAIGMLVETLRNHGVDATGVDISPWAIKQVPDDLRPYCSVGSIVEPFADKYDLITCIEVLEHLPPVMAEPAISNLCAHADAVLISSTPDDVIEPSHLNVEPPDYWARMFAEQGFTRDFSYDAGYLSPQAVLFRRGQAIPADVVAGYEQLLRRSQLVVESARLTVEKTRAEHDKMHEARETAVAQRDAAGAEHDALAARFNELAANHDALAAQFNALTADHGQLMEHVGQLEQRRAAEAIAADRQIEQLERGYSRLVVEIVDERAQASTSVAELSAMRATKLFRYSRWLRSLYGDLRHRRAALVVSSPELLASGDGDHNRSYETWVELYDTIDETARVELNNRLRKLADHPLVSVILPVYNTPEPLLRRAIESVRDQIYGNWELCIADDMSTDPMVVAVLDEYAEADERIRVVHRMENGHIAAASNSALQLASGSWIAPMDHDDELAPHALAHVALVLAGRPEAGMLYTDEDKIDLDSHRHAPYFKPDFDPLLLLGQNYLGHLIFYRHDLVKAVGGYREGLEGSQDWDLSLRISELLGAEQVVHLPRVLYHWRAHPGSTAGGMSAKPYATLAGRRAVVEHLARQRRSGDVITNPATGWHRIKWHIPSQAPKVSIIVPTRDGRLLARCLDSLFRLTSYPNYEIAVVDNGSLGWETLDYLRAQEHLVRVIRDERPFNYSALNNFAASRSDGDVFCLLNDDCEITSAEWLDELVGQLSQDGVGAVGAKLLYPDGRIQHAGVVLGLDGVAGHVHRLSDRMASGHGGRLHLAQSFSAVTAACMVVRREAWEQVGGLDTENLAVAFNDVDLCLRIGEAGWRIVWTPFAEMVHHESATRGADTGEQAERFARECAYMKTRWAKELRYDPAYNPNLALQSEGWELAFPPRLDRT